MKNQWRIIVGFVLALIIVLFAILNNNEVNVSIVVSTFKAPLILIILGSAIIGAMIALLTSTGTMWSQKKTIKTQEKELAIYKEEMDKQVQQENEKVIRDYENQISELRATYEAKLVDKNRQIDRLMNDSSGATQSEPRPDHMQYFD